MMKPKTLILLGLAFNIMLASCSDSSQEESEFTGNEVQLEMIPGTVENNTTSGQLVIRERLDGRAQIEITLNNILDDAQHPVHLHFGSLDDDGEVATFLNTMKEENGVGKSITILNKLDDDTALDYTTLMNFNGSIKIHFESSGPLENEILGSTNIGINTPDNEAYLTGIKSITVCNSNF